MRFVDPDIVKHIPKFQKQDYIIKHAVETTFSLSFKILLILPRADLFLCLISFSLLLLSSMCASLITYEPSVSEKKESSLSSWSSNEKLSLSSFDSYWCSEFCCFGVCIFWEFFSGFLALLLVEALKLIELSIGPSM